MPRLLPRLVLGLLTVAPVLVAPAYSAEGSTYKIEVRTSEPPSEIHESIRKLLSNKAIQLYEKDELVLELWFRKEVPVKASEAQIKNGLTYAEVPLSTLMGAVRIAREVNDYRKQKLALGSYTLRFATQPMDGDHADTAPSTDFFLVCPAAEDTSSALLEVKDLRELSAKITEGRHPSPLVLFPGKGAKANPVLVDKGEGHRVLLIELDARASGSKAKLSIGLTLVGASSKI